MKFLGGSCPPAGYGPAVSLSLCLSVSLSLCLSVSLSLCLYASMSLWLSVTLSLCIYVSDSICCSVFLSLANNLLQQEATNDFSCLTANSLKYLKKSKTSHESSRREGVKYGEASMSHQCGCYFIELWLYVIAIYMRPLALIIFIWPKWLSRYLFLVVMVSFP